MYAIRSYYAEIRTVVAALGGRRQGLEVGDEIVGEDAAEEDRNNFV